MSRRVRPLRPLRLLRLLRILRPWIYVAAFLAALVAWSAWQRWVLLAASPFPVGVDGYYYPIQLRALLEHGHLAYPASPLSFWLMAPLAAATDPICGAKLGAAILGAAIAVPAYGVGARLGGGRGAGLLAAALATTSAGSAYLTVEFVKNGVGLTVALGAVWLALRAVERPSSGRLVAAGAGFAAAVLAHKMAAGLAAIVIAPAVLLEIRDANARGALRGRRLIYLTGGLVAVAAAVVAIGIAFPQRFLSPGDGALLGGLVTGQARWSAPALDAGGPPLMMGYGALIGAALALVAIAARVPPIAAALERAIPLRWRGEPPPESPAARRTGWAILAIALVIALPWLDVGDRQGLAFRLRVAAFAPMALAAAVAARAVLARVRDRDFVLALAATALAARPLAVPPGEIVAHPAMVAAVQALNGALPPDATLVCSERQIMFMATWYTRAPATLSPDAVPPGRRLRLVTRSFIVAGSPLYAALLAARDRPGLPPPIGTHPLDPNGLVLVPEAAWDWALTRLGPTQRAYYAAWPTI